MISSSVGLPVRLEISGGEVSDYKGHDLIYDGDRPTAKVLIAHRGYDGDRIREDCQANCAAPVIPGRRIATRYDKTAYSYLGFLHIAVVRLWFRNV